MKQFGNYAILFLLSLGCNDQANVSNNSDLLPKYCLTTQDTCYTDFHLFQALVPDSVWNNKLIIGCGQSSHGSHENFEIQASIFKLLVEKKGCRTFIMEASYPGLLQVNNYVNNGTGTKESVMQSLGFWTWDTEEVWNLIEWIRNFNMNRPMSDKIMFLGNDMQEIQRTSSSILSYFSLYNPQDLEKIKTLLGPFLTDSTVSTREHSEPEIEDLNQRAFQINQLINLTQAPKDQNLLFDFLLQKRNGALLQQSILLEKTGSEKLRRSFVRDSLMAVNIKWAVDSKLKSGPVFVWAHNGHIDVEGTPKNMGGWLKEIYNNKYYALGIDFIIGSFNARNFYVDSTGKNRYTLPVPCSTYKIPHQSLNYHISNLNANVVFFNLSSASYDSAFLQSAIFTNKIHSIGAVFMKDDENDIYRPVHLRSQFDAIIFFKHSTPTHLLNSKVYLSL